MEKNKRTRVLITMFLVFFLLCSLTLQQAFATSIYWGVFYSGCCNSTAGLTSFETDAGKSVAFVNWFQSWGKTDGAQLFQPTWMDNFRNHGSIPMITWQPGDATNNVTDATYSLANIYNGNFDSYITTFALAAKSWGHPFFLRFAHEMNGTWYSWSEKENGNNPGDYIKAWKHVHDIFTQNGVTNATWVWCVNIDGNNEIQIDGLYPGSSYVDWVAMDGYNFGTVNSNVWKTFSTVFTGTYNHLLNLAPDKPMMIAETNSEEAGGSKSTWYTDAFSTQIPTNFPKVKAVGIFNVVANGYNWPIESSTAAQNAFASAISSSYYASNTYGSVNTSPIPLADASSSSSTGPTATPTPTSVPGFGTPAATATPSPTPKITPATGLSSSDVLLPNNQNNLSSISGGYTLYVPSHKNNALQTFFFTLLHGIGTLFVGLKQVVHL